MAEQNENGGGVPATWEEVFEHKRFKELNERAKKAEADLKAALDKLQASGETATQLQARLKELEGGQSEMERLQSGLQQLQAQFEQSQQALETERLNSMRLKVATDSGLPASFAARLSGTTEDELRADAATLREFIKPATPGSPPPMVRRAPEPEVTEQQMNDPKWVRENMAKLWPKEGQ